MCIQPQTILVPLLPHRIWGHTFTVALEHWIANPWLPSMVRHGLLLDRARNLLNLCKTVISTDMKRFTVQDHITYEHLYKNWLKIVETYILRFNCKCPLNPSAFCPTLHSHLPGATTYIVTHHLQMEAAAWEQIPPKKILTTGQL